MRLISDMNVNDKNLSRTRMLMSVFPFSGKYYAAFDVAQNA